MKKLQTFDSSYFKGKSHSKEDEGTQNYLVFQPINKYFKKISNTEHISESKSKALSDEVIKPPTTTDNGLVSSLNYAGNKIRVKSARSCLKQDTITFSDGKIVKVYFFVWWN